MQIHFEHARQRRVALYLAGLIGLGACASLDPTEQIETAASLVTTRTDVPVDWQGPWDPATIRWPMQPLDPADAARLALHNHAGLRTSIESITRARADYVQAHLLPNPVLNFTLGFPIDGGGGNPAMGTLLQPLAALWQRPAAIDAAASRLRASVLTVSNAALELVAQAELAHAELVFAERDLALALAAHELTADAQTLIDQRLTEGEAAQLDRNRSALEVLDAERSVTDAQVRRDRAQRALLEVCGVADTTAEPRVVDRPVAIPAWIDDLSERDVIRTAEEQRLDLAATRRLAAGAIDEVRLAELRRIPDVTIGGGYQRNFAGREAVGPAFGITLPIFDDGRAEVANTESLARAAVAETERVRQGAIGEVRRAWIELRGALSNLARLRDAVLALAIENRTLAEQSLDAGVIDLGTVLDLRARELRVRLDVNRTELAAVRWFIELERAVGGLLPPPGDVPQSSAETAP